MTADSIKANPGGIIAPNQVVGRDPLITDLWARLGQQSVILSAERRMGKTTVIRKMEEEPQDKKLTIRRDMGSVRSTVEFTELVYADVEQYLSRFKKAASRTKVLLRNLSGAEINIADFGFKFPTLAAPHWKQLLTSLVEDLVAHQGSQVQMIFFWDEVPWMLQKIAQEQGPAVAVELLDTLRGLRQTYHSLRMVFTGSIGLHHVLDSFRETGYNNPATNDMYVFSLPPLDSGDAAFLARVLLTGEEISIEASDELVAVAAAIARSADYVPYYIHHLVLALKQRKRSVNVNMVGKALQDALTDSQNQWQLEHYQTRLKEYYPQGDDYIYALNILDIIALAEQPLTVEEIQHGLQLVLGRNCDRELIRKILVLLKKDHYLVQQGTQYGFQFSLIERYWQLTRG